MLLRRAGFGEDVAAREDASDRGRLSMPAGGRLSRSLSSSIFVGTLLYALIAAPAYGRPGDTTVPDSGARPVAAGPVVNPGSGTTAPAAQAGPPVLGPLALQIINESRAVQALGEQVNQADVDLEQAREVTTQASQRRQAAAERLATLRAEADTAAADAYKRAAALGPYDSYARELQQLSVLVPGLDDQPGGPAAALELRRAEDEERITREAEDAARANEAKIIGRRDTVKTTFDQRNAALTDLKTRNAAELVKIETQRDTYEQSLGGGNLGTINIDGMGAHPDAIKALRWGLDQQGKPYKWGEEGPHQFDCSGLVWAAYRSVNKDLPRVANAQYNGTPKINPTKTVKGDLLIPGDLVFFGPPGSWTSIHHVGIYLGGGRMLHAPNSTTVVKISPVWWSEFYGATRIFPAVKGEVPVPVPGPPPPANPPVDKPPTGSPAPSPTPSDRSTPAPDPSPKPTDPDPSPSPSISPSPSPSPSQTAPPTASAGATGSGESTGASPPP